VGGPRAAFILAESGIGKSRLVQALYQQLTTDPGWDPPEVNYWPDAFNDQGMQLRVVPDMEGHEAKGPPRFAWLGARWQPTDVRNVSDRRTALPEIRHSIMVHAEILRRQGSAWQDATGRIREAIRRAGPGEVIGQMADSAVPFGGLLLKLVKGGADLARDRLEGPRSFGDTQDAANKSQVDEVCECLHLLVDGAGGLPMVLWLDDAQWIDAQTQEFVRRIWWTAKQRKWPLLMVVTHWEREWRELQRAGAEARLQARLPSMQFDLTHLQGDPGVEVRVLDPSSPEVLDNYAGSRLPGLTTAQRAMLLEKAAGNFLTMVENVGQLLRVPQNFVDRDASKTLSAAGERKVGEWESDRQRRVEQRFTELAPELRDMLGWGSHLGVSFLREVVEEFAERVAGQRGARERLREAVDPLVILGEPSEHLREFRDRAFHHVAGRHFLDYGEEHREQLDAVLCKRLVEWVNNSFDGEGNEIWPRAELGIVAPPRSVTGLPNEEARDVLGMAVRSLPLGQAKDWGNPEDSAALRARYLLIRVDWEERLWDRVRENCQPLATVDWASVGQAVLSKGNIDWLATTASDAGAFDAALTIHRSQLANARDLAESLGTPESLRDVSINLTKIADIEFSRGDGDAALAKYQEALEIFRSLAESLGNPGSYCLVSASMTKIADIEFSRGNVDAALAKYQESLTIARALAASLGDPEILWLAILSLGRIADIELSRGDVDAALAKYQESLQIAHSLAESLNDPTSLRGVAVHLMKVAEVEDERGDADAALVKYQEALEIFRSLAKALGNPDSLRSVAIGLTKVAGMEVSRGDVDAALAKYQESLASFRSLAQLLGNPQSLRDVSVGLMRIADIEVSRGEVDAALAKYQESLTSFRSLAQSLGNPESLRDVAISLERIADIEHSRGDVDAALLKHQEALEILRSLG
jgi:tetratricopeptide (TPR) repeat protein